MKRIGRPPVTIDLAELEKLGSLQCTDDEIASYFGVDRRTITRKKKQTAFREALERGRQKGRISIRRTLFQLAQQGKQGSVAAAIFLAKNLLGYKDVTVTETDRQPSDPKEAINLVRAIYGLGPASPTQTIPSKSLPKETPPSESIDEPVVVSDKPKGYLQ